MYEKKIQSSASIDSNVIWRQAQIPHSYTSTHGPVRLATIGRRIGRSIAVASSRGLCVLDLSLVVAHNGSNERDAGSDRVRCVVGHACSNSPDAIPIGMKNGNAKWRLFRNEKEEQSFRVVAMSWWERNTEQNRTSEDLLVAAIEYMSPDKAPNQMQESQYFLVCWSRRRLGMGPYQLLGEADSSLDSDRKVGIALPKGLKPNAISILAEPTGNRKDARRGSPISSRAVLLISSARSDAPVTYMAYQLQALESTPVSVIDALDNQNTSQVLSRLCSTGRISSMGISSTQGHISSPFLAGASFQFDLTQSAALVGFDSHAHVATIGIIHADGSLSAVCVTPFGPSFGGLVIPKAYQKDGSKSQLTNFWLSDVIEGGQLQSKYMGGEDLTSKATRENSFIWTLARNDGRVFSWRVPFFLNNQKLARADTEVVRILLVCIASLAIMRIHFAGNSVHLLTPFWHCYPSFQTLRSTETLDPKAPTPMLTGSDSSLGTPVVVKASNLFLHKDTGFLSNGTSEEDSTNSFLGKACYIGDSSFVTGNATNDNEIAIGPLPPASKGCVLYVGQNSRNLQPRLPNSQGMFSPGPSPGASNILQFTIFGTGECILGPSTIISSLYLSYADVVSGQPALASNPKSPNILTSQNYINSLLRNRKNEDVVFSALRIIVLQTVGALASMRKRPNRNEKQAVVFARALLREVVSTTRSTLPPLVFCRFFLGLGRQLEPHDFTELFPLPYHDYELNKESPLSFESLFEESLRCGSIAIPSAALPLFSSRMKSLSWCKHLLWQCLYVIRKIIKENISSELDESLEEKEFVLQLYKFGVKLEDVNNAESTSDYSNDETENEAMISLDANSSLYDSYEYSDDDDDDDDDDVSSPNRGDGEIQQPRSRMSRLVSLITPMIWDTTPAKPSKDEMEEKAIADAASTFIFSVFDDDNVFNQKDDISTNIDESILTVVEEEIEEKAEEGEQSNFVEENTSSGTSVSLKLSIQVPSLVHRSIAGIVCEHLVDEFHEVWRLHPNDSSSTPSWMAIACLATLMGEGRGSLSPQAVADFRHILQSIPEEDLMQYAKPDSNVLVDQIAEISQHFSGREADSVFDLILVLLQRNEIHQDVQEYSVPLIIMAIIMGNISGRLDDVLVKGGTVDRWYSAVSFGEKRCEV